MKEITSKTLFGKIRAIIVEARRTTVRTIDFIQVWTNYQIGHTIVEHEQRGERRATYAERTIDLISEKLTAEFGRGFAKRNLEYMRQFYLLYQGRIAQSVTAQSRQRRLRKKKIPLSHDGAVHPETTNSQSVIAQSSLLKDLFKLSWTHYLFLMAIDDPDERAFYEIEAADQHWSVRELKRQFDTSLYERLALSRNKSKVRELAKRGQIIEKPEDAIKEPYILEFLGLDEKAEYTETQLESAIIDKIEHFLLELGKGFLFESRQKRLTINEKHFHVDLVLYNRLLRCYVLIDLKIGEITHQNIGQMQMYVNYIDRKIKTIDENPSIGIILCKKKDDAIVEFTLPQNNKRIFASRYKLYLPSKEQFRKQIVEISIDNKDVPPNKNTREKG